MIMQATILTDGNQAARGLAAKDRCKSERKDQRLRTMNGRLRTSIVLCTYNGIAHLEEQLGSLLSQTRPPDEVVIGDDGSTDGTWSMLLDFARACGSRGISIRLKQQPRNLGFVANFSDMLRQATGDLLFLCDQDDVWRADKLATMVPRFVKEPKLALLASDARLVDADGRCMGATVFQAIGVTVTEIRSIHAASSFDVLLRRSMMVGATTAFRRELLPSVLPVAPGWIHDEWLGIVLSAIGRVDVVEDTLIDYRQHARNQVGMRVRKASDWWRDMVAGRATELAAELARVDVLQAVLASLGAAVPTRCIGALEDKRAYLEARISLGRVNRAARARHVWRQWRCGVYHRFGTGVRTALRDMLRYD
jgi:cellulose synthase/poly-beta-1,6-N-acetylglucosamine synthase-like glycosyltransferase